eukprot:gb/GFBE01072651.1/.p1 GENE.gb/GFBE01072651.1/~~gb/GFBE01072651.1/.p1  ORF type:complete len:199 (+),score=50.52 gb/GFBE01072651.1/:1-597(+)
MALQPHQQFLSNQGASDSSATASLSGRQLPADLVQQVSNVSMGQLFYILSHIQKLSAQAPVTAQRLLAENPQICQALLHAECVAGMLDEPMLPMTADELRRAKAKARQMQDELAEHELPPPAPPASSSSSSTPFSKQMAASRPASLASPPGAAPAVPAPDQKAHLMQKLMQLTPDQISKLPPATKVQLLNFLQQNKRS